MYVLVKDGAVERYPFYLSDLKKAYPNTSFPASPSDEQLAEFNVFRVYGKPEPTYDHATQVLEYPPPVYDAVTGKWTQTSYVRDKTPEELAASAAALRDSIVQATQQRLDDFARTRNYDGILSLCTYATSVVPKFQAEGQYGVTARDATWARLYEILAEVEAGTRPMPSGYAEIEPLLPVLEWPQ